MTEQQRKVFEAWYNDEYVRPIIPADRTEGGYQHPDAQAAWDAWQAALTHAEGEAVDHWAVRNPGLADQFRAEAQAVRKRLGFEPDAGDVSPNDLRERIAEIEGAPQVAVPELTDEMVVRGGEFLHDSGFRIDGDPNNATEQQQAMAEGLFSAMLAAAPTAPQVAVPPGWSVRRGVTDVTDPAAAVEFVIETSTENGTSYITSVWLDDEDPAHRLLATMLAAPTAPAEKHPWTARLAQTEQRTPIEALTSDLDAAIEKLGAHPLLTDAQTLINEALCTLGAWHDQGEPGGTGEQPVSDPDGLPEPGRREAEQAYINGAFDYARDPIGSRDWVLFWNGWQARDKSAPAPDEREIAALREDAERYRWLREAGHPARLLNNARWTTAEQMDRSVDRLRAGKEGEPS